MGCLFVLQKSHEIAEGAEMQTKEKNGKSLVATTKGDGTMAKKQHTKRLVEKTKGDRKMTNLQDKRLVRTYKKHVRLYVSREQLLQLGIITEDDGLKRYIPVFKKDNRYNDNGLHIVNHIFTEENQGD